MTYEYRKTLFIDIDGCLLKHLGNLSNEILGNPEILPGVLQKLNEWDGEGHKIILTTGRKESMRKITEEQLSKYGIKRTSLYLSIKHIKRII